MDPSRGELPLRLFRRSVAVSEKLSSFGSISPGGGLILVKMEYRFTGWRVA